MAYSYNMKNKLNNKNIMSTNSKFRILLCLTLPLALATGCASDPNRSTATASFIDVPTPIVSPVSKQQAADIIINNEIFKMVLADTDYNYGMWASVDKGVVTLVVTSPDWTEKQRFINKVWELAGVNQVKDRRGANLASTLAGKNVAAR